MLEDYSKQNVNSAYRAVMSWLTLNLGTECYMYNRCNMYTYWTNAYVNITTNSSNYENDNVHYLIMAVYLQMIKYTGSISLFGQIYPYKQVKRLILPFCSGITNCWINTVVADKKSIFIKQTDSNLQIHEDKYHCCDHEL